MGERLCVEENASILTEEEEEEVTVGASSSVHIG